MQAVNEGSYTAGIRGADKAPGFAMLHPGYACPFWNRVITGEAPAHPAPVILLATRGLNQRLADGFR